MLFLKNSSVLSSDMSAMLIDSGATKPDTAARDRKRFTFRGRLMSLKVETPTAKPTVAMAVTLGFVPCDTLLAQNAP